MWILSFFTTKAIELVIFEPCVLGPSRGKHSLLYPVAVFCGVRIPWAIFVCEPLSVTYRGSWGYAGARWQAKVNKAHFRAFLEEKLSCANQSHASTSLLQAYEINQLTSRTKQLTIRASFIDSQRRCCAVCISSWVPRIYWSRSFTGAYNGPTILQFLLMKVCVYI